MTLVYCIILGPSTWIDIAELCSWSILNFVAVEFVDWLNPQFASYVFLF